MSGASEEHKYEHGYGTKYCDGFGVSYATTFQIHGTSDLIIGVSYATTFQIHGTNLTVKNS
jgi:hypothetical protein